MFIVKKKILLSLLLLSGCTYYKTQKYPIDSDILTTRERTIIPPPPPPNAKKIHPYQLSQYEKNGYGLWHYGPGIKHEERFDLMPPGYKKQPINHTKNLLRFWVFSDIHITDKETPAQAIYLGYKGGTPAGYSGPILYTTHVLDATIQTINALHKKDPFDFGISLGDTCNNTQYNETRWYIDIIDGKKITPSSGNHTGSETIEYQKPFKAAGLDKSIKWYQVLGNHDHFWMGFLPPNDYIRQHLTGKTIINLGNPLTDPKGLDSRGFYMGAIDGATPNGDIIGAGSTQDFQTPPTIPAADPDRRSLTRNEWMGEFFNSSSMPNGHGFSPDNVKTGFACYAFEPKTNLPLKIIVLDDTQRDDDPSDPNALGFGRKSFGYGHGELDAQRYNWLINELDKGQKENKLMIIAAHIPIGIAQEGAMYGWNKSFEEKLIAKLHTYPNLILWLAGHLHVNTIIALKSPDPQHPEFGFWEVLTSSLRDFPQQFRTFDIVRNNDNTISIFTTNVDPAVKKGSPAAKSRSYALAATQLFHSPNKILTDFGSYNAELIKQINI